MQCSFSTGSIFFVRLWKDHFSTAEIERQQAGSQEGNKAGKLLPASVASFFASSTRWDGHIMGTLEGYYLDWIIHCFAQLAHLIFFVCLLPHSWIDWFFLDKRSKNCQLTRKALSYQLCRIKQSIMMKNKQYPSWSFRVPHSRRYDFDIGQNPWNASSSKHSMISHQSRSLPVPSGKNEEMAPINWESFPFFVCLPFSSKSLSLTMAT